MPDKRLFVVSGDRKDCYTSDALELSGAAFAALKPLADRFILEGYSMREISHVLQGAVYDLELETILSART
jgi:hypothetical protein